MLPLTPLKTFLFWLSKKTILKHLFTFLLLISAIATHAQLGITAGVNASHFTGPGKNAGSRYVVAGFSRGIYDQIKLSKHFDLQPQLLWIHKGAKNVNEDMRTFSTYSVEARLFVAYRYRSVSFMAAPYIERVSYARNRDFRGDNFHWNPTHWPFYKQWQKGIAGAIEFDFVTAKLHLEMAQGITQVRFQTYNDKTLWSNKMRCFSARLAVPLKTFQIH